MDKILSKFLKETRSSRYIIGTSLYDILRHPLHGTGPAKRIAKCLIDTRKPIHPSENQVKGNGPDTASEKREGAPCDRQGAKREGKRSWLIKYPAPEENKIIWGDYHFCVSLADALTKQDQYVEIQMHDEWDKPDDADVVLVIRGALSVQTQKES